VSQPELSDKPFAISKQAVVEAFRKVRANQGGPGVDGCTIEEFESDLRNKIVCDVESDVLGQLLSAAGESRRGAETAR